MIGHKYAFLAVGIVLWLMSDLSGRPETSLPTYLSPKPGSLNVSPGTSIAIRFGEPFNNEQDLSEIFSVVGEQSGNHEGSIALSDDRLTMLFYPNQPFSRGEKVWVSIQQGRYTVGRKFLNGISYEFSIIDRIDLEIKQELMDYRSGWTLGEKHRASSSPNYRTHPEFTTSNLMTTTVTTPAKNVADGYIFTAGLGAFSPDGSALQILDNRGEPIFLKHTLEDHIVSDFKVIHVEGSPFLVYYVGVLVGAGWSNGVYHVLNQAYKITDHWTIGNNYLADLHDLEVLDSGHAYLLSYTPVPWDLSPYGGPSDGTIMDILIQEQDSHKNVVFEWRGSEHIPITDTLVSLAESPVDYMHTNAIEVDEDGNLLISSRNLSEVTKIDRQTGNIIWRLGGQANEFTFVNDIGISFQHDIRRLPDGRITLFDNGNQHQPPHSRAVRYVLVESGRTVTHDWQYPEDTSQFAPFAGNYQSLENGNAFISWGSTQAITEVRPNGEPAFGLALGDFVYRSFRYPWDTTPAEIPRSVLVSEGNLADVTLFISWNGATGINSYEIYAGSDSASMSLITTISRSGFESTVTLSDQDPDHCVYQARPVHDSGVPMPFSNPSIRLGHPGCRELLNLIYFPIAKG